MSEYDSTISSYDNQINRNNQRISECNQRIKQLEDDIEELKRLKLKMTNLGDTITSSANSSVQTIYKLPSIVLNPKSILKVSYFGNLLDAIKGKEHSRAQNGVENANRKIKNKISELQRTIQDLNNEIVNCSSNINTLSTQKQSYITSKAFEEAKKK